MDRQTLDATPAIIYPDSDGKPMGDNTLQIDWINKFHYGLEAQYRTDPNVFVANNLLWYPVFGNNRLRVAPDVLVALGRPKGRRGSYQQWLEGGLAPTVVFEIRSPGNRAGELRRKFRFFQRYGVQEYYLYDPDRFELHGWQRRGNRFTLIAGMDGWVSPALGIRFDLAAGELRVFGRGGEEFLLFCEIEERRQQERQRTVEANLRADEEKKRAEAANLFADQERRAKETLQAKLRELGIDPDSLLPGQ